MMYILLNYLEIFSIGIWLTMLTYFVSYEIINFIIPNIIHKPHPRKGIAIACSFGVMFMHLFIAFTLYILLEPLIEIFINIYIDIALYLNFNTIIFSYLAIPTVAILYCIIQYIFFKVGLKDINKIRKGEKNER